MFDSDDDDPDYDSSAEEFQRQEHLIRVARDRDARDMLRNAG